VRIGGNVAGGIEDYGKAIEMENQQIAEAIHELSSFATETGRVLANHKKTLQRHEEVLLAQYRGGSSHADAIKTLREDVRSLSELVGAQGELVTSMQRCLIKILTTLGLPTPEEPPSPTAAN